MQFSKKLISLIAVELLPVTICLAEQTAGDDKQQSYNIALVSLVGLMLILLFVVGMLAGVMKQLGFVVRDKNRKERKDAGTAIKTMLLLLALNLPALRTIAQDAGNAATVTAVSHGDLVQGIPDTDLYWIVGVIALEVLVIFLLVFYINILLRTIRAKPELHAAAAVVMKKNSWFWDKFNKAATIEHEKDILLDHDYDGIQELDNSLPPWWKYGFIITILVAVIYLYRFHISHDGLSQQQEYAAEMQKGEEDKAAYLAKSANNVDETNVVALTDATSIAAGKETFEKNCSPCHVADGGGNVGPNLTDDYWLHGGSVKDIFKSIKYGWQDKGMKSWKDDLSPRQIQQVASFIKTLHGTHPAVPKAPQGDLYIEASDNAAGSDSSNSKSVDKVAAN